MATLAERFAALLEQRKSLRENATAFLRWTGRPLFPDWLEPPEFSSSPRDSFGRLLTCLYQDYWETSRDDVLFLIERSADRAGADGHRVDVQALRTIQQHDRRALAKRDPSLVERADKWYRSRCGTTSPSTTTQWSNGLRGLLEEAATFYSSLRETLADLANPEKGEFVRDQWLRRLARQHAIEEFDPIVSEAAADCGRRSLNVTAFRNRHRVKWLGALNVLPDGYDFSLEARKLVERDLVLELVRVLPLSAKDIIDNLGLSPGRSVERALLECFRLQIERQRGREELLDALRANLPNRT